MGAITRHKAESAIGEKVEAGGYAELSREERAAWGVLALLREVSSGSLLGYFDGSTASRSEDALRSFTDVGASDAVLEAVRQAVAHFQEGAPVTSRDPIFEASTRVLLKELPVLEQLTDRHVWKKMPDLRARCHECTSATLVALFARVEELVAQGTAVEIGGFGQLDGRRTFRASPELQAWVGDGIEATVSASDLAKLAPVTASDVDELHELCRRLHRDEVDAVVIGGFYLGFLRFPGYEGRNPRTGEVIVVPGNRSVVGGFLADGEHP